MLIRLCPDEATARWAAHPIRLGIPDCPSLTVRPLVLGRDLGLLDTWLDRAVTVSRAEELFADG